MWKIFIGIKGWIQKGGKRVFSLSFFTRNTAASNQVTPVIAKLFLIFLLYLREKVCKDSYKNYTQLFQQSEEILSLNGKRQ